MKPDTTLVDQIEIFLLQQNNWVPARVICREFGINQRQLRAKDHEPGLIDHFAVSSCLGYRHTRMVPTTEFLKIAHAILRHSIAQFRKVQLWRKSRHRQLTIYKSEEKPKLKIAVEIHSGQELLPL